LAVAPQKKKLIFVFLNYKRLTRTVTPLEPFPSYKTVALTSVVDLKQKQPFEETCSFFSVVDQEVPRTFMMTVIRWERKRFRGRILKQRNGWVFLYESHPQRECCSFSWPDQ